MKRWQRSGSFWLLLISLVWMYRYSFTIDVANKCSPPTVDSLNDPQTSLCFVRSGRRFTVSLATACLVVSVPTYILQFTVCRSNFILRPCDWLSIMLKIVEWSLCSIVICDNAKVSRLMTPLEGWAFVGEAEALLVNLFRSFDVHYMQPITCYMSCSINACVASVTIYCGTHFSKNYCSKLVFI